MELSLYQTLSLALTAIGFIVAAASMVLVTIEYRQRRNRYWLAVVMLEFVIVSFWVGSAATLLGSIGAIDIEAARAMALYGRSVMLMFTFAAIVIQWDVRRRRKNGK